MKTAPANTVSTERLNLLFSLILLLLGLIGKGISENLAMPNSNPLDRPGVSLATLQAEGIHHVTAEQAHKLMRQYRAGVWIPYYHVGGEAVTVDSREFGRLRLDVPTDDRKYTQVFQGGVHGYIPRCFKGGHPESARGASCNL